MKTLRDAGVVGKVSPERIDAESYANTQRCQQRVDLEGAHTSGERLGRWGTQEGQPLQNTAA